MSTTTDPIHPENDVPTEILPPPPPVPPRPAPTALPVQDSARIQSIDVLRGVAVLGILYMNIQSFSMPDPAYSIPVAWGDLTGINYIVWLVGRLFADQRFMTIFSMLFGAGIILMSERLETTGRSPVRIHYRRMLILLAFGAIHSYAIWTGDILFHYALCGMLVFLFRKLSPVALVACAFTFLIIGAVIVSAIGLSISALNPELAASMNWTTLESMTETATQWEAYRGSYAEQWPQRFEESIYMQTLAVGLFTIWRVTGVMLLGMALYKIGFFQAQLRPRTYVVILVLGAAIALPLEAQGIRHAFQRDWEFIFVEFHGEMYNYWASIPAALAWCAAIMLCCRIALSENFIPPESFAEALFECPALYRLASVGRMAFTNYIAQTLICTTIFYGHGFGLFGEVSRTGQLGIVVAIWIAQLIYSPLWLHYFRMGPLEYLWRTLTYARLQPIRRKPDREGERPREPGLLEGLDETRDHVQQ